ncbi:hypothetical protein CROQUDRAFT_80726 [Cronartium quercuum f. sp. fusiforme G11]|uniref:Kynurenine formamidase n=1 Tax=Cronartium quercuum f. sp. fusiforme G11 TaxID=708437 RepID=A0A9P6TAP6_9BASI|nr:hypothetical protein CROQUDRAFT_80726 [Cronartium quercuum f. sp. fusiforme G11]
MAHRGAWFELQQMCSTSLRESLKKISLVSEGPHLATHRLDKNIVYEPALNDPLQKLDLYLPLHPSATRKPLICYVHGGAWRSGDKAGGSSLGLITLLAARFPQCAIASINYRLSRSDNNVKHPDHNKDVTAALNYLVRRPHPEYDSNRIFLVGHSVGAYICLSVSGLLSGYPETKSELSGAVAGLVLVDGIYGLRELVEEYPSYRDFVEGAMGLDHHPYNWNAVSPTHWQLALKTSTMSKILVIHSRDDTLLSTRQSQLMIDHLHQLFRGSPSIANPSIEVDFDSVKGDHDELLSSPTLADRLLKWIKPSST